MDEEYQCDLIIDHKMSLNGRRHSSLDASIDEQKPLVPDDDTNDGITSSGGDSNNFASRYRPRRIHMTQNRRSNSSETFEDYRRSHQPQSQLNASFASPNRKIPRRHSELRQNVFQRRNNTNRDSFELKQDALHSMQVDGTLEHLSALENLRCEEEWNGQQNIWKQLALRASPPDTSQKELIHRSTFLIISSMTVGAGVLWGLMYVALQEYLAALMPIIYSSCMGLVLFTCICNAKGKYDIFVEFQLTLILLLPMAVHVALGGIEKSGGVMLWSFLCPVGAAFFRSAEESKRWFTIYLALSGILLCMAFTNLKRNDGGERVSTEVIHTLYFLMNILGVKSVLFAVVFFFARELEKEYTKSEEVLANILPAPIVKRIKRGEFPIVDHVAGVSILFADLVGFTKASTELHPNFLIGLFLRDVFQSFDELVDKYEVEKIKTIGDAYMVVGGLNHKAASAHADEDNHEPHTIQIMLLARDMFNELTKINHKYNLEFGLRIGIHTGPVVAGVLGLKRFTYDVWGDSVNVSQPVPSLKTSNSVSLSFLTCLFSFLDRLQVGWNQMEFLDAFICQTKCTIQ